MGESSDPVSESAKAAQEIAKTTGKAIDASREAGGFIARYIDGPLEQAMGIFEDKLRYMRWERQLRFMKQAEATLKAVGLDRPTRALPMKLAIPLLQGAAMEEDDFLQDRWVNLLVNSCNAVSGVDLHRSFVEILEHLNPLEASLLDVIYSLPFEQAQHNGIITTSLPSSARIGTENDQEDTPPLDYVQLALANLSRLDCIRTSFSLGGGELFGRINPTILGRAFVHACRIPIKK